MGPNIITMKCTRCGAEIPNSNLRYANMCDKEYLCNNCWSLSEGYNTNNSLASFLQGMLTMALLNNTKQEEKTNMVKCVRCGREIPYYFDAGRCICENCYTSKANLDEIETNTNTNTQAIKSDNGKPRLDLVPLEILEPLAQVLGKYGESGVNNWAEIEKERYLAALLRHLVAYQKDNNAVDEESGLPAIYHVLCNAAFLAVKHKNRKKEGTQHD